MPRKPVTDLAAWPSLTLEGNLLTPAMVAAIAEPREDDPTKQSYGLRKGLSIRDEISTAFRVGQAHFDAFRKIGQPSPEVTRRFVREFLTETFGFHDLVHHEAIVSFLAGGRVPIVVTPPSEEKLDRRSPSLSTDRSRSAAFALQDYLNDHEDALWGLATNGNLLRIMRDNASLTRPAYIEADLSQIFTNEDAASFSVLWLLCHRSRFGSAGTPATDCALERWRDAGTREGIVARDRLAGQVQLALKVLGSGFLEANPALATRIQSGELPLTEWFNELLRLVYRLIFLMVAEDRNLLHPATASAAARSLYAEGYSLAHLRALCTRASTWDRHHDRFEAIKIVFRSLDEGEAILGLPALGGLFAGDKLPTLGTSRIRNRAFMEALYRLSWLTEKSGMVPVNWRAMETEELGSVYESLLELQPQLGPDGRSLLFASEAAEQRGNQRKTTGSYYTPDSLVQAVLDSALDPVLEQAEDSAWRMADREWRMVDQDARATFISYAAHQRLPERGGLATQPKTGEGNLPANSAISGRGTLQPDQSNAPGGSLDPLEHGGGLGPTLHSGVHPIPEKSQRQPHRAGDAADPESGLGACHPPAGGTSPPPNQPDRQETAQLGTVPEKANGGRRITDGDWANAWQSTPFAIRHSLFASHALMGLRIIDPACGSGHFLLAAARRIATRLARIRAEGTPSTEDFRHALRDVARCCIHGVDRNPMAVELTKVALWIETVDPSLPLGFFDAQIRCGDALLGVFDLKVLQDGIPDAAYKPLTGDDKDTAKYYAQANKGAKGGQGELNLGGSGWQMPDAKPLAVDFSGFRGLPEESLTQIAAKAKRFEELRQKPEFTRVQAAADLYIAAFLLPKTGGAPAGPAQRTVPTTEELWQVLNQGKLRESMAAAPQAARRASAFHWPLEFPDVMQRGGFDVVLGNPPWERIKLQEQEFFAARSPEIAGAANKAARDRLIKSLATAPAGSSEQLLFNAFVAAKREAEATSEFVRVPSPDGGRFALSGRGDVNTYALFAEHCANIARFRAGVIVPTGIATDATTAPFFAHLVESKRLARLIDFENRAGLFPAVDSRMKFSLLILGRNEPEARFAFFLTDPAQLAEPERNFTLSPEAIARINPNTKTAPVFRSRADAELTAKIYSNAPVLLEESAGPAGNPWGVSFQAMFHMSNDSHLFRTAAQLAEDGWQRAGTDWVNGTQRYVPLYEAKMIHQFDHRWAGYASNGSDSSDISPADKQNPTFEPDPRYWVPQDELDSRLSAKGWERKWLTGWRDITNATNERTVISAVFPRVGAGDTLLIKMPSVSDFRLNAANLANLTSISLDYASRQKIGGTHMKYNIFKQLPILPPDFYTAPCLDFIVPRVLELTYTSHSLAPFARDLGYDGPPFGWDEERRALLRAELDAFYARAYGLDRDELRYILDPADVKGPDYPSETFRVLKEKEIRQHGEYRTRRLVLEAWDRMAAEGEFATLGL
jgi:hypothetical protein